MTFLEQLITQQVSATIATTLSRTTAKIAEEMADEIMKDADFRVRMVGLIKVAFEHALEALDAERPAGKAPDAPV